MTDAVADAAARGLDPDLAELVLSAIVAERARIVAAVTALPAWDVSERRGYHVHRDDVVAIVNARTTA